MPGEFCAFEVPSHPLIQTLLEIDDRWSRALSVAGEPSPLRSGAAFFAHSGDSWFWGLGLVIIWLAGDAYWRSWAALLFAAIAVTALLVMAIKVVVRRSRPPGEWGSIYRRSDPHSFPSGHAARAVLLALLIAHWGPPWLAPWMAFWAPLVILARVALGLHYLSDMLAGALLGGLIGFGIVLFL